MVALAVSLPQIIENGFLNLLARLFRGTMEFYLNGTEVSLNSANSVNLVCVAGAVVASWSPTQEVVGLSPLMLMTNVFVTELAEFRENI